MVLNISPASIIDTLPYEGGIADDALAASIRFADTGLDADPGASMRTASPPSFESQFDAIIRTFGNQLRSLERAFNGVLKNLTRGIGALARAGNWASMPAPCSPIGGNKYRTLVGDAARRYELDPNLLRAVIQQESGFNPNAVSNSGARGLMQLMPQTAAGLGVTNPLDPAQNVDGGARLLRQLIDRYGGRLDLALAAYNAGPGAVDKYGGVPPYSETQDYVRNILGAYRSSVMT
jgi:soluble lytic murein transglycosylase-like protein